MKERVRITFGGVEFSGIKHGDDHITVPVPAFRKILAARQFAVKLAYDIEHDGCGRRDRFNEHVGAGQVAAWCQQQLSWMASTGRPHLLYFRPSEGTVTYCPHSNESYTLRPATEYMSYAVDAAGELLHCGPHRFAVLDQPTIEAFVAEWERWAATIAAEHPDCGTAKSMGRTTAVRVHPVGHPEQCREFRLAI